MNVQNLKQHLEQAERIANFLKMPTVERSILKAKNKIRIEVARQKCMKDLQLDLIDPDLNRKKCFKKWGLSKGRMYDK